MSRANAFMRLVKSGTGFPPRRLLVNLASADVAKSGVCFNLVIALALLAIDEQLAAAACTTMSGAGNSRWTAANGFGSEGPRWALGYPRLEIRSKGLKRDVERAKLGLPDEPQQFGRALDETQFTGCLTVDDGN